MGANFKDVGVADSLQSTDALMKEPLSVNPVSLLLTSGAKSHGVAGESGHSLSVVCLCMCSACRCLQFSVRP